MVIVLLAYKTGFLVFRFLDVLFIVYRNMLDKHKWFGFHACQKGKHLYEPMLPRFCMIFVGDTQLWYQESGTKDQNSKPPGFLLGTEERRRRDRDNGR